MHWFYFSRYRFIEPPRSADEILSSFLLCPWTDKQNLQPTRYFPLNISFFFFPFLFRLGSISSKFSFFLRGCLPFFHFFHFFIKDPDVQFILPLRIYAVPAWESQWMWLIGTMSSRFLSLSFCFFFFFCWFPSSESTIIWYRLIFFLPLPFFIHLYLQNRFPFLLTSKDFCLVQNIHALILWERWGLNISSFLPFFFFSTFSIQSHFFSLHF